MPSSPKVLDNPPDQPLTGNISGDGEDPAKDCKEEEDQSEKEVAQLREFIDEVKKKNAWKLERRVANMDIDNRPEESDFHKLDSSLKKNTAFIRKLKNFTDAQKDTIKKEMASLNLTKYIGEVASAIVEAKLKLNDLNSTIDICSFLHQRYSDFSSCLLESYQRCLSLKKDEKITNPSKFRVDLRLFAELIACGVFTLKEGLPLLGQVLTTLVAIDKEEHINMPLLIAFCKHCGDDYAGLIPRKMRILADKHQYEIPQSDLLPPEKQKNVRQMLYNYYFSVGKHVASEYKEYHNIERTNRKILLTKGEVHKERQERAEELQLSYKKLMTNCEQLAEFLDLDLPVLEEPKRTDEEIEDAEIEEIEVEVSALGTLWEDEESKSFYEDLVDLKAFIPAILYKDSSLETGLIEDKIEEEEVEIDGSSLGEVSNGDDDVAPPDVEDDTEEADSQNTSNKMLLDAFLAKLPTCISREMIDNAAAEFCMSLNTKTNRKKLVKSMFAVHRNRQDLLPFYCRFVATLYPCMPDVAVDLAQYLKQEFRWQLRKKDQMKIESKLKVSRYIGEMVKFRMFAKSEALFCMKMLLFDFTFHHIEMACTLMESCGRYLYRLPESHQRTKIYLEQMMRKKTALSMDSRYSMMIENVYYNVNPPEVPLVAKIKAPAWQEYIHKLLYSDLAKNSTEKVLRQMRKLDWTQKEVSDYAILCLVSIWNIKYNNVRCAASLLAGLVSYHKWVGLKVVDAILEEVRIMMEVNDPKYNQRRISTVKFLAELYNYRLVDSGVIFKVLYSLISFGASLAPDEPNAIDPPDHTLRIRLICVILDTCGIYFTSGSTKKKLDYFFTYFQRYFWRKKQSPHWNEDTGPKFPVAVRGFMVDTLVSLRPKIKLFQSLEEAEEATEKIERDLMKILQEKAPELTEILEQHKITNGDQSVGGLEAIAEGDEGQNMDGFDDEDAFLDDDEDDENSNSRSRSASRMANREIEDNSQEDVSQQFDFSQENEPIFLDEADVLPRSSSKVEPKLLLCEEDKDFQAMFDKMLNENISESKNLVPRGQQNSIVAPTQVKHKKNFEQIQMPEPEDTVQFTVLLRKGNKPSYKEIAIPIESEIARNLQKQEEIDRLEKERVKKLTLQINERQKEEEVNEVIASMQKPSLVCGRYGKNKTVNRGAPDANAIFGLKRPSQR